jgi:hypothetical protein
MRPGAPGQADLIALPAVEDERLGIRAGQPAVPTGQDAPSLFSL